MRIYLDSGGGRVRVVPMRTGITTKVRENTSTSERNAAHQVFQDVVVTLFAVKRAVRVVKVGRGITYFRFSNKQGCELRKHGWSMSQQQ